MQRFLDALSQYEAVVLGGLAVGLPVEIKRLISSLVDEMILRKVSVAQIVRELRKLAIKRAYMNSHGNKSGAARVLGLARSNLYRYLKSYGEI